MQNTQNHLKCVKVDNIYQHAKYQLDPSTYLIKAYNIKILSL